MSESSEMTSVAASISAVPNAKGARSIAKAPAFLGRLFSRYFGTFHCTTPLFCPFVDLNWTVLACVCVDRGSEQYASVQIKGCVEQIGQKHGRELDTDRSGSGSESRRE